MDDLDDHLAGFDRFDHLGADGLGADRFGERTHDVQRDVGFEQRAADLAHGLGDVGIRQGAAARELVENTREAI